MAPIYVLKWALCAQINVLKWHVSDTSKETYQAHRSQACIRSIKSKKVLLHITTKSEFLPTLNIKTLANAIALCLNIMIQFSLSCRLGYYTFLLVADLAHCPSSPSGINCNLSQQTSKLH